MQGHLIIPRRQKKRHKEESKQDRSYKAYMYIGIAYADKKNYLQFLMGLS